MKLTAKTKFNCTKTGTTGKFRPERVPFKDQAGFPVTDYMTWTRSRNKQRNYETLVQTLGMRTQLMMVSNPKVENGIWEITVEPEKIEALGRDLSSLLDDCKSVPMLLGLDEDPGILSQLVTNGNDQNIWFLLHN